MLIGIITSILLSTGPKIHSMTDNCKFSGALNVIETCLMRRHVVPLVLATWLVSRDDSEFRNGHGRSRKGPVLSADFTGVSAILIPKLSTNIDTHQIFAISLAAE
jgi:hypothetical protein